MFEHHSSRTDCGKKIDYILPRIFWGRASNGFKQGRSGSISISSCCYTHSSLYHRPQVSNNISKHVVCDNHVKPLGIFHKPHRDGINMGIINFYVSVLLCYFVECSFPQVKSKSEDICFSAQGKFLHLLSFSAVLKGIAYAPLDTLPGIN